jgi:diguanylate cyclase (GGDEF)-like protein
MTLALAKLDITCRRRNNHGTQNSERSLMTFVAIGSAHLDVIARSEGDPKAIDQPGRVKIEVGGTACNVAINWARLGLPSRLLTIGDGSAMSNMVLDHVRRQGVHVVADPCDDESVGVFCAHLNRGGDLVAAISDMPIENHHFSDDAFDQALDDARYALLDCNLSAEELSAASIECLARAVPFAVAGVSEEKCLKLNGIRSMPSLVSLNHGEATYFLSTILRKQAKDPMEKIFLLSDHLRCPCVMTMGSQGAIFYDGKSAPIWDRPERPADKGNRLGAGDGFLAAFIHAMDVLDEQSPSHALNRAMRIATLAANKEHANLGSAKPLQQALDELGEKAYHDPLTGLNNRAGAQAGLDQRRDSPGSYPLCVLLLDIDHFKSVNDTLGHDQGDEAIRQISALAKSCLRVEDIASRWGGEEFVCFLPGAGAEEGMAVAERIRAAVEEADILDGHPLTISVGVSVADQADALEPTIKKADEALYLSKQNGRNQVTQL